MRWRIATREDALCISINGSIFICAIVNDDIHYRHELVPSFLESGEKKGGVQKGCQPDRTVRESFRLIIPTQISSSLTGSGESD